MQLYPHPNTTHTYNVDTYLQRQLLLRFSYKKDMFHLGKHCQKPKIEYNTEQKTYGRPFYIRIFFRFVYLYFIKNSVSYFLHDMLPMLEKQSIQIYGIGFFISLFVYNITLTLILTVLRLARIKKSK